MIFRNYKVDYMFLAGLISITITAFLVLLANDYPMLMLVIPVGVILYSHKPTRLTTKNTEANIG